MRQLRKRGVWRQQGNKRALLAQIGAKALTPRLPRPCHEVIQADLKVLWRLVAGKVEQEHALSASHPTATLRTALPNTAATVGTCRFLWGSVPATARGDHYQLCNSAASVMKSDMAIVSAKHVLLPKLLNAVGTSRK